MQQWKQYPNDEVCVITFSFSGNGEREVSAEVSPKYEGKKKEEEEGRKEVKTKSTV